MKNIVTLTLLVLSQVVYADVLIVGDGIDCDFDTIGDAIAAADPDDEIRVTNTHIYYEHLLVGKNLTIKGGYSSCANAQSDTVSSIKTTISALNLGNVLYINTDDVTLEMSGFRLINGRFQGLSAPNANGGAVSLIGSGLDITFSDMFISNSTGIAGGGIMIVQEGDTFSFLRLINTRIYNNTASSGGGIYCHSDPIFPRAKINLTKGSGIIDNHAINNGGGIYQNHCITSLLSGEGGQNAPGHLVGISLNSAEDSGGGIYATNDSYISAYYGSGLHDDVVNIDHNTANTDLDSNGDGGGVYLSNNSEIEVYRLFIHENKVVNGHGGGLYLDNSRIISSALTDGYNLCLEEGHIECNLFSNNSAIASVASPLPGFISLGGAIYMINNSLTFPDSSSLRARFINNAADNGSAIGLYQSTLDIQGSYFINNGDGGAGGTSDLSVFVVYGENSVLDLSFSTMVNNFSARVFQINNFGTVNLFGSIVYEAFGMPVLPIPALGGNSTFNFGCSIFHENDSIGFLFPNITHSLVSQNPGFVSEASKNFHLRSDSIAIDRCDDDGLGSNLGEDRDLDIRGFDFPGINHGFQGNYDVGADEAIVDLIFANGFELL